MRGTNEQQCIAASLALVLAGGFVASLGQPQAPSVEFVDITHSVGIGWEHVNGATPEKYLIETMGGGGAFLDFNRDGLLDIFLVDSGCHPFSLDCEPAGHALFQQNEDGSFREVTKAVGLADGVYGMGVAVGDYNNDGYPDIYVTNFGPNQLFRNNGDGTFTDATAESGTGDPGWGTSAAFFDYNRDGWLDLYVGNYLDWTYEKNIWCGRRQPGYRSYCHPDFFPGVASRLYRNEGDGTFTDVTEAAGVGLTDGKALGVVAFDYNRDGWPDLYVANDAVRNFLFRNNGDGTFEEVGLLSGVAYGFSGKPESGMGTDAADYNRDGWPDLFVTNIDYEPNNLLRNNGDGTFMDVTVPAGLTSVALLYSGFGTRFLDFDNNGTLDLIVLNGHVMENIHLYRARVTFRERPFLFENRGGRFVEVGEKHGSVFTRLLAGRALASGDIDNDGDIDLLWVNNGQPPLLLRNDGGNRNAWVGFELVGSRSNRDAVGAVVTVKTANAIQVREIVGGASYCAGHDLRLLFGLGKAETVEEVVVRWPSGASSRFSDLRVRRYHRIEEPVKETGTDSAKADRSKESPQPPPS